MTADVPGVHAVTSHLHIGLFPGDTRPSEGSEHPAPSPALASVLGVAHTKEATRGCHWDIGNSLGTGD